MNALERGLKILELLACSERPLGVTEIGTEIGVDKSAAYRLLALLVACGYVEQVPETKRYQLTTRLVELSRAVVARLELLTLAKPFLRALALRTGQSVHLAVMRDWRVVYLDEALPASHLRVDVPVGGLAPAHCTALGKAILCQLPPADLDRYFSTCELTCHTSRTLATRAALAADLARARERGYAVDDEEFHEGVRCLAAPVCDHTGQVIAALGISGPAASDIPSFASQVVATAGHLSRRLGYYPQEGVTT